MIPELGHLALWLAVGVTLVLGIVPMVGAQRGRADLMAVARPASHWVSDSMSSALPLLARCMDTLASRTSGCCTLSACAQRATVRCASSGVMQMK